MISEDTLKTGITTAKLTFKLITAFILKMGINSVNVDMMLISPLS